MKVSKYLIIFSSVLVTLIVSYLIILIKYLSILLHHYVYYCQEMVKIVPLNLPVNWGLFVLGILSVSIFSSLFKLLASFIKINNFRQKLAASISHDHSRVHLLKSLNLEHKISVLKDANPFAYCLGVRRPQIYISTGLLDMVTDNELKVILRHEQYHLEHKDNLTLLLASLIELLFPYFAILHDLIHMYKTDRELQADQAAMCNDFDKFSLSSVLRKLLLYETATLPAIAVQFADSMSIEIRIKTLLSLNSNYRKFNVKNVLMTIAFVIILLGLIGTPVHAVELHNRNIDAMIVCNRNFSPLPTMQSSIDK